MSVKYWQAQITDPGVTLMGGREGDSVNGGQKKREKENHKHTIELSV